MNICTSISVVCNAQGEYAIRRRFLLWYTYLDLRNGISEIQDLSNGGMWWGHKYASENKLAWTRNLEAIQVNYNQLLERRKLVNRLARLGRSLAAIPRSLYRWIVRDETRITDLDTERAMAVLRSSKSDAAIMRRARNI